MTNLYHIRAVSRIVSYWQRKILYKAGILKPVKLNDDSIYRRAKHVDI